MAHMHGYLLKCHSTCASSARAGIVVSIRLRSTKYGISDDVITCMTSSDRRPVHHWEALEVRSLNTFEYVIFNSMLQSYYKFTVSVPIFDTYRKNYACRSSQRYLRMQCLCVSFLACLYASKFRSCPVLQTLAHRVLKPAKAVKWTAS